MAQQIQDVGCTPQDHLAQGLAAGQDAERRHQARQTGGSDAHRLEFDLAQAPALTRRAGWKYDQGLPCGPDANAAKFYAAEVGFRACTRAVATHGGMGYAKEYHVERYLREMMIPRIAPISPQLILCHIAEKVLGLPKSY